MECARVIQRGQPRLDGTEHLAGGVIRVVDEAGRYTGRLCRRSDFRLTVTGDDDDFGDACRVQRQQHLPDDCGRAPRQGQLEVPHAPGESGREDERGDTHTFIHGGFRAAILA